MTLTGQGGSGKTRLALGVARAVTRRYPHGVWFVDLAALRDPGLLEAAIASALGIRESPERAIREVLRSHLRERTALLVLDNLEQLLPAARAKAMPASAALSAAPRRISASTSTESF